MVEQATKLTLKELKAKVEVNWVLIEKQYLTNIAKVTLKAKKYVDDGIWFYFELPHNKVHHFTFGVYIAREKFDLADNASLRRSILKHVSEEVLYKVGNYQIEEAENPTFTKQNHYGYKELDALHKDEDPLIEAAETMLLASLDDNFDKSFNPKYGYLPAFTDNEVLLAKLTFKKITEKFKFSESKLTFKAFKATALEKKAQVAFVILRTPQSHKKLFISLFGNTLRQYEQKFAKKGYEDNQAVYFIIRTYLIKQIQKIIKENDISEVERDLLSGVIEQLPKQVEDFK